MLPHTALRTARPSWQPAAPVPVSEPGRRAVGRQRGPGRPWGRLRGGADRRAPRQYAVPVGPSRVRRVRAARRGGQGRRGRADASAATGRVRGAHAERIRAGRGRGRVRSAGAGASRRRGRGRVGSRASHARGAVRNRTASRAVHRRSPSVPQALAGRAGAGRMCLWHARGRPLPVGSGRPRGASGSCALGGVPGADRPRRCCPGDYLPLAASLSFEPAETFTL